MKRFPMMLGLGLVLAGCEDELERLTFSLSAGDEAAASEESVRGGSLLGPAAGGQSLVIDLDQPVHWIEIERCLDSQCKTFAHGDYCSFEYAEYAWQTAMGEEPDGFFPDELRGEPRIAGRVTYGELPEHAGWQQPAQALREGERYGLNVYVHKGCEGEDDSWLCTAAIGCQYFTIQNGEIVPYEPGRDD